MAEGNEQQSLTVAEGQEQSFSRPAAWTPVRTAAPPRADPPSGSSSVWVVRVAPSSYSSPDTLLLGGVGPKGVVETECPVVGQLPLQMSPGMGGGQEVKVLVLVVGRNSAPL